MTPPNATGTVRVNTANIYYECCGGGEQAMLLLHGNSEDGHCFDRQLDDFARRYRVVVIDSRGHGRSSFGEEDLTIGRMALDVFAVMDALGIKKAVVVGFSDGGNIALRMALLDPSRITKLVAAGPNLTTRGVKWYYQLPFVLIYYLCRFVALFSKGAGRAAQVINLMVKDPGLPLEEIKEISLPALILGGQHDMIRESHLRLIADSIKGARLAIIPRANHFVFGKAAQVTNAEILRFVAE